MSRFNTGNPLGSGSPLDLDDNAKNLDVLTNSREALSNPDRFGVQRKSWYGMERDHEAAQSYRENQFQSSQLYREAVFANFLQASGYQDLGEYAPGIEITAHNQYVTFGGQPYLLKPSVPVPYTTSGEWTGEDFKLIGDHSLRQDLANPDKGAALVARGVVAADSIADLLSLPEGQRKEGLRYLVKGYHAGSDVGGGEFYWDKMCNKQAADGGSIIDPDSTEGFDGTSGTLHDFLASQGLGVGLGCFVRLGVTSECKASWFGLDGYVGDNASPIIQKAIEAAKALGCSTVYLDGDMVTEYTVRKNSNLNYVENDEPCFDIRNANNLKLDGCWTKLKVENHGQGILEVLESEGILVERMYLTGAGDFPQLDGNTGRGEKGTSTSGYHTTGFWGYVKNNSSNTSNDTRGGFGGAFPQYDGGTAPTWGVWNGGFIGNHGSGILIKASKNVTVRNNRAAFFNDAGIRVGHVRQPTDVIAPSENVVIENNVVTDCYNIGIGVWSDAEDVSVINNEILRIGHPDAVIENTAYDPGYGFATTYTNIRNIKVHGNTVKHCIRKNIDFHAGQDISVKDNYCEDSFVCGVFTSYTGDRKTKFMNISNNILKNTARGAKVQALGGIVITGLYGSAGSADMDANAVITGNIIINDGDDVVVAITSKRLHNVTIANNMITSEGVAIQVTPGDMVNNCRLINVSNNSVQSVSGGSIEVAYCESPVVMGNNTPSSVFGNGNTGIVSSGGNNAGVVVSLGGDTVNGWSVSEYRGVFQSSAHPNTPRVITAKIDLGTYTHTSRLGSSMFSGVLQPGSHSVGLSLSGFEGLGYYGAITATYEGSKKAHATVSGRSDVLVFVRIYDLITGDLMQSGDFGVGDTLYVTIALE